MVGVRTFGTIFENRGALSVYLGFERGMVVRRRIAIFLTFETLYPK